MEPEGKQARMYKDCWVEVAFTRDEIKECFLRVKVW
jgi:hypothetical protein